MKDNSGLLDVATESIPLVIADGPFGIDFDKDSNYNRTRDEVKGYVEVKEDQYHDWCIDKLTDLRRVLKPDGVIFWWCACVTKDRKEDRLYSVLDAVKKARLYRAREIIWGYQFAVYNPKNFAISHQHVLMLTKQPKVRHTWNGHYEEDAVFLKRKYQTGKKTNITETNMDLLRWIIKLCSNKGDTILDPFFGSGRTGEACNELGRHCIGYELNKNLIPRIRENVPTIKIVGRRR